MWKYVLAAITGSLLLLLAGCGKSEQRVPKTGEAVVTNEGGAAGGAANAAGAAGAQGAGAEGQGGASAPGNAARVIYFDFDSSEIKPEFVNVIAAHAKALARNASVRIRLEGHTDE